MNIYKSIKVCLFDFDGTLIDTMESYAYLAGSLIEEHYQIPYSDARQLYIKTSGIPFFQQLEILFPDGSENETISNDFEEKKQKLFLSDTFQKETLTTLSSLKNDGYLIGISSSNFHELVNQFLEKEEFQFDIVLGFKENFNKGRDHFNYVMEKTKCELDEILFIGDSLLDGEKAMDCKVKFIGKVGTFTKEDFKSKFPKIDTIESIKEIERLLLK